MINGTYDKYFQELSSLPYLAPPFKSYKLPILENTLKKKLFSVGLDVYRYLNQLTNLVLEEPGCGYQEYLSEMQKTLKLSKSTYFFEMMLEFFSLQNYIRSVILKNNDLVSNLNTHQSFDRFLSDIKTCKHKIEITKSANDGDLYQVKLLSLQYIWNRLDYYSMFNHFNLEAVFIYLLRWKILNQWLVLHNKNKINAKLKQLLGEKDES